MGIGFLFGGDENVLKLDSVGHRELVFESEVSRNILGKKRNIKNPETLPTDFSTIVPSCYHVMS